MNDLDSTQLKEKDLDPQTTAALDVIKSTGWLQESVANRPNITPTFDTSTRLPSTPNLWTAEVEKQKENKMNQMNTDQNEIVQHIPTPGELMSRQNYESDVTFTVEPSDERNLDQIADDIIDEFTLNRKQKTSKTNILYWRCIKRASKCKAAVKTQNGQVFRIKSSFSHNHEPPNPDFNKAADF